MKNQLKTVLFLGILTALLIGIGGAASPGHIWLFAGIGVVFNLVSYFFSDRIVLRMHRAREVSPADAPRLAGIITELAAIARIPVPRLYVIEDDSPNAFATGRNPSHAAVAVTTGILQIMPERELRAVLAHELSHVRNRDVLVQTVAAVIASLISSVAWLVRWGAILGGRSGNDREGGALGLLALAIVAPIAAVILQLWISRTREFLADEKGAALSADPDALADALLRLQRGSERIPLATAQAVPATASLFIVNPLSGGAILRLFSTHPPIEERVRRLRALAEGHR